MNVLITLLGLGTINTQNKEKSMLWFKIPALVAADTAGDVPGLLQNIQECHAHKCWNAASLVENMQRFHASTHNVGTQSWTAVTGLAALSASLVSPVSPPPTWCVSEVIVWIHQPAETSAANILFWWWLGTETGMRFKRFWHYEQATFIMLPRLWLLGVICYLCFPSSVEKVQNLVLF